MTQYYLQEWCGLECDDNSCSLDNKSTVSVVHAHSLERLKQLVTV